MTLVADKIVVPVVDDHGNEDQFEFKFHLSEAEGVCTFLTKASAAAQKVQGYGAIATVLATQAEAIEQGLHVQGIQAPDLMLDIQDFHQKFGLEYTGKPRILEPELFGFRKKFIEEEFTEWQREQAGLIEALTADDGKPDHRKIALGLHEQLDALVDMVYVVLGTAYLQFGADAFHEAWRRVQAANMSKVRAQSADESKRGSTFDVVKPQGWTPPDHHDLVKDHAHSSYRHQVEQA